MFLAQGIIPAVTVNLSGNQTVIKGSNVTFNCIIYSQSRSMQLRSNWFLIFPADRNATNIRLQAGIYTPNTTDTSLFHVSKYPGLQVEFSFVRISKQFDMVEVQCFSGGITNSSFIEVISKLYIAMYIHIM